VRCAVLCAVLLCGAAVRCAAVLLCGAAVAILEPQLATAAAPIIAIARKAET